MTDPTANRLSHVGADGAARMVDVTDKEITSRAATAVATVHTTAAVIELVSSGRLPKGEALAVARVAGIMGAKQTSALIPLCHPLPLSGATIEFEIRESSVLITATVKTTAVTGVEMEALTGVTVAALTVYDMIKAVDKHAEITDVHVVAKSGGKSGDWVRDGEAAAALPAADADESVVVAEPVVAEEPTDVAAPTGGAKSGDVATAVEEEDLEPWLRSAANDTAAVEADADEPAAEELPPSEPVNVQLVAERLDDDEDGDDEEESDEEESDEGENDEDGDGPMVFADLGSDDAQSAVAEEAAVVIEATEATPDPEPTVDPEPTEDPQPTEDPEAEFTLLAEPEYPVEPAEPIDPVEPIPATTAAPSTTARAQSAAVEPDPNEVTLW